MCCIASSLHNVKILKKFVSLVIRCKNAVIKSARIGIKSIFAFHYATMNANAKATQSKEGLYVILWTGPFLLHAHVQGKRISFVELCCCCRDYYPMRMRKGVKQSVLSVIIMKITRSGGLDVIARCKYHYSVRNVGNLSSFAFKKLEKGTSVTNRVFLSATPINHTQLCHVLLQLCMLDQHAQCG